jgi:hypothetical protein
MTLRPAVAKARTTKIGAAMRTKTPNPGKATPKGPAPSNASKKHAWLAWGLSIAIMCIVISGTLRFVDWVYLRLSERFDSS